MKERLFSKTDAWSGGYFELALELGASPEQRLQSAFCRLWEHPTIRGCYLREDIEPIGQQRIDPSTVALERPVYGIAYIPDAGKTCCATWVTRNDEGSDWLTLGIPMGSLSHVLPVGAYPFDDGKDLAWRGQLHTWLRDVAEWVFDTTPFLLGLVEHDISGKTNAAAVHRDGIPSTRWLGYLLPTIQGLEWHGPTEVVPFSWPE